MKKIYLLHGNLIILLKVFKLFYFLREFAMAGYLNLTQKYTRKIIDEHY